MAKLLLAEDNLDDLKLMLRAFRRPRGWEVRLAHDGAEVLDILMHPTVLWRPNLIILNLNLPKLDGHDVLRTIKKRPELAPIPVVVWSVSCSESDIDLSYQLGAAAYFSKPVDSQDLLAQARTIRAFFEQSRLYEP